MREELVSIMPEDTLELVRAEVKQVLTQRFEASDRSVILQLAQYNLTIVKEPDLKTVYALRALAAAIGIRSAMELRDEVEAELEPKDLINAQQMAAKLYEETRWPLPNRGSAARSVMPDLCCWIKISNNSGSIPSLS
jgi:hypothetical protein